jgi:hypothetical protein
MQHSQQNQYLCLTIQNVKKANMKKNSFSLIKGMNWALAGLMSLLGFSSCDVINGDTREE